MAKLRAFWTFWYDFIVGDDWRVAVTVTLALAVTLVVNRLTASAPWSWAILVMAVAVALPASIQRVARSAQRPSSSST